VEESQVNPADLPLVLDELTKTYPAIVPHIRVLTQARDTPFAAAATELLSALLVAFDRGQQYRWQLRDLLELRGGCVYAQAISTAHGRKVCAMAGCKVQSAWRGRRSSMRRHDS
jgi:hypothetical protein